MTSANGEAQPAQEPAAPSSAASLAPEPTEPPIVDIRADPLMTQIVEFSEEIGDSF
jgi:hypothetical protein